MRQINRIFILGPTRPKIWLMRRTRLRSGQPRHPPTARHSIARIPKLKQDPSNHKSIKKTEKGWKRRAKILIVFVLSGERVGGMPTVASFLPRSLLFSRPRSSPLPLPSSSVRLKLSSPSSIQFGFSRPRSAVLVASSAAPFDEVDAAGRPKPHSSKVSSVYVVNSGVRIAALDELSCLCSGLRCLDCVRK